jgi:iron-sulfur cluster assembly protein
VNDDPESKGVGHVLTITQTAAEALDTIVASTPDASDTSGLRISQETTGDGQARLTLALAQAPEPSDQVVEGDSVSVFVDSDVAPLLDDKVLDAQVSGDEVGFTLTEQQR